MRLFLLAILSFFAGGTIGWQLAQRHYSTLIAEDYLVSVRNTAMMNVLVLDAIHRNDPMVDAKNILIKDIHFYQRILKERKNLSDMDKNDLARIEELASSDPNIKAELDRMDKAVEGSAKQ